MDWRTLMKAEATGRTIPKIPKNPPRTSPSDAGPAPYEINELNEKSQCQLLPGSTVKWESPGIGRRSGEVAMAPEGGWLIVRDRSVTGKLFWIKIDLLAV